jgi:hypothetical protein
MDYMTQDEKQKEIAEVVLGIEQDCQNQNLE